MTRNFFLTFFFVFWAFYWKILLPTQFWMAFIMGPTDPVFGVSQYVLFRHKKASDLNIKRLSAKIALSLWSSVMRSHVSLTVLQILSAKHLTRHIVYVFQHVPFYACLAVKLISAFMIHSHWLEVFFETILVISIDFRLDNGCWVNRNVDVK